MLAFLVQPFPRPARIFAQAIDVDQFGGSADEFEGMARRFIAVGAGGAENQDAGTGHAWLFGMS